MRSFGVNGSHFSCSHLRREHPAGGSARAVSAEDEYGGRDAIDSRARPTAMSRVGGGAEVHTLYRNGVNFLIQIN
jgi:hypothetical protein